MKVRISNLALVAFLAAFTAFSGARAAENSAMMEPVKSVYDHYLQIQGDLAKDSMDGVPDHAKAIAKAVRGDDMKMLPVSVAKQADTLAAAKEIKAAREAFKPLSASLIKYANAHKILSPYREAYCPMAKASWIQTDKEIKNPYFGKEMLDCGEFKN